MKYATRINSFLRTGCTLVEALADIGRIDGVDYVDLNYPEHFKGYEAAEIKFALEENGLRCNAVNLRFREKFLNGEFGNSDVQISEAAVALCKEAVDACESISGSQIIIWLGFDGFDYSFQMDYVKAWNQMVSCFTQVCDYSKLPVSIEYKPYEERSFTVLDSFGATMMMLGDVNRNNLGVTLDFCHMLMKKENPAYAVSWLLERGKLYNMHVNDGEGSMDDGLIVGTVNLWKTLEVFYYLEKYDFQGVLYFDTFPKREGAVAECQANVAMCNSVQKLIHKYGMERMGEVISKNDATAVSNMMVELLS
ncbi:MAG: sugar phosphate isomerase/epimerase family protein [Lachnospiraceae bacterium]